MVYFLQFTRIQCFGYVGISKAQVDLRQFLIGIPFHRGQAGFGALGKAVHEYRSVPRTMDGNCPVAAPLTLTFACHSFLDQVSSKIAVVQSSLYFKAGIRQLPVANPIFPCKTGKPFRLEYPHPGLLDCSMTL